MHEQQDGPCPVEDGDQAQSRRGRQRCADRTDARRADDLDDHRGIGLGSLPMPRHDRARRKAGRVVDQARLAARIAEQKDAPMAPGRARRRLGEEGIRREIRARGGDQRRQRRKIDARLERPDGARRGDERRDRSRWRRCFDRDWGGVFRHEGEDVGGGDAAMRAAAADFGKRARDGQLKIDEMQGGTFTITNGGIYGSLMSTPILNAPQSGILGMHKIQERPMVVGGKIEIRPMMYLALSYDHRIVDGKEAVTFLVRVKESLEDPQRLILDL